MTSIVILDNTLENFRSLSQDVLEYVSRPKFGLHAHHLLQREDLYTHVYVLTYICMYIHYCTMHAAPHPLEYTDIATKPQTLFTILVN